MTQPNCLELARAAGTQKPISNLFSRIVILDYYDGPVMGVVRCNESEMTFKFEMLAWEGSGQGIRIFGLYPIASTIIQMITAVAKDAPPQSTLWVPDRSDDANHQTWDAPAESKISQMLNHADAITYVVASRTWLADIVAIRQFTGNAQNVSDWFAFLGISGQAYLLP